MWTISALPSPDLLSEGLQKLPSLQLIESNICYVAFSDFVLTWASSNFKAVSQLDPMRLTSFFKSSLFPKGLGTQSLLQIQEY